jgi:hypothetical protein
MTPGAQSFRGQVSAHASVSSSPRGDRTVTLTSSASPERFAGDGKVGESRVGESRDRLDFIARIEPTGVRARIQPNDRPKPAAPEEAP